jgi:integrase
MARKSSPWYWEERGGWYVNIAGKREILGEHPADAPKPKKSAKTGKWNAPKEIEDAFHKLMTGGRSEQTAASLGPQATVPQATAPEDDVLGLLDDFLTWCFENRDEATAARYKRFCKDFVKAGYGKLAVSALTSKHVTEWLAGLTTWNSTTKRNAITALQRAFNWACKNRGLDKSPLRGMEKPAAKRRSSIITPADFDFVLTFVKDQAFKDLLIVSYDSGCRPQEVKRLEARHIQIDMRRAVIPAEEAKGKRRPRTIYFPTDRALEAIERLRKQHPSGPLFRNAKGNAWTAYAVHCRFRYLETFTGVARMKERGIVSKVTKEAVEEMLPRLKQTRAVRGTGKERPKAKWELRREARVKLTTAEAKKYGVRFNHYQFRRTWITEKLIAGVDSHVVAKLAGHQSTDMIDKHYSQVADDHEFMLREAMRKIEPKGPGRKKKEADK